MGAKLPQLRMIKIKKITTNNNFKSKKFYGNFIRIEVNSELE